MDIRVPALGESISEATVGKWLKKPGDAVKADEPLVELETDKVAVEVPAPMSGVLGSIAADTGATVPIGALLGSINSAGGGVAAKVAPAAPKPAVAAKAAPEVAPSSSPSNSGVPPAARKVLA
ncbi:MAG: biotin/lipoyl-containing protein, partial [Hyphomicrobium sp.]